MTNAGLFALFGGMALLWYGIHLAGEGLQRAAGGRLRQILSAINTNRVTGAGAGILVTVILQSSAATVGMLVRFAGSGLMTLPESMGVILGADIGTTLTVQLLAFRLAGVSLLLVGLGVVLQFAARRKVFQYLGQGLLGFGLIYLGMQVMAQGMAPLRESPLFQQALRALAEQTLLGIVASALFTGLVASSAAAIGLALSFAHQGLLPLAAAMPIILGANIGSCAASLAASLGGEAEAKRVALAHVLLKVAGVALVLPVLDPFVAFAAGTSADGARQIANAHTLFNVGIAVLFLPLIRPATWVISALIPKEAAGDGAFRPRYLDERFLDTPAVALGQATREAIRMADIVADMLRRSIETFHGQQVELVEAIERQDDQVDILNREIKRYVTKLSQQSMRPEESRREIDLLSFSNNLENLGDIVDRNLMELAKKKMYAGVDFSEAGQKEIEELHGRVLQNLETAIGAFAANDPALARRVLDAKAEISQVERGFRQNHIRRLHEGLRETIETSEIHLDVLSNLKRINSHITAVAYPILERD
ncbi:MAG TPA: Na/Pi cotransporter family protein [Candidatus Methylomirabilis sp.]|jgi:phosphate:Na+ symporter